MQLVLSLHYLLLHIHVSTLLSLTDVDVDDELPLYEEIGDGAIYQDIPDDLEPYQPTVDDLILTTKPVANDGLALLGVLPARDSDRLSLLDAGGIRSKNPSAGHLASQQISNQGSATVSISHFG